jgi:hypothetical protein
LSLSPTRERDFPFVCRANCDAPPVRRRSSLSAH